MAAKADSASLPPSLEHEPVGTPEQVAAYSQNGTLPVRTRGGGERRRCHQ